MGTNIGGIAFHFDKARHVSAASILASLFGAGYRQFEGDYSTWRKTQQANDVSIEIVNDTCFLYDDSMSEGFVFQSNNDVSKIMDALCHPTVLIAFGYYESGGGFGYAIFENRQLTRRRAESDRGLIDEGEPKAFERLWLDADMQIEQEVV